MEFIDKIKEFVNLILVCVPFVILCIVSLKQNIKKEQRYKQVFWPIVALVYCIVAVIFLNNISDIILGAVYWLAEKLSFLSFLREINWAYYSIFVVNTALIAGFMFVKGLLIPISMGVFTIPALANKKNGVFYYTEEEDEKEEKKDVRYLKAKFRDAKKIISAMYWAMLLVFVILLVVTYYMTSSKVFSAPFYPAFGIIVFGEIVAFLSGLTYQEKEELKPSEEEKTKEKYDYDKLAEKYSQVFGNRLLQASHEHPTFKASESVTELLEKYKKEYEETLNQNAALLYTYYNNQLAAGKILDESYICQTRNILEGKSVVFFTQFYNDTTDYVFLPVIRNLMKRKKILVVLGHGGNIDNIKNWFYNGISNVTGFEKLWKIDGFANATTNTSVMVLDTKNIYNQKLLNEKSSLLSEVSMVFIIEPNRLLGTLQIGLSCLISYLRQGGNNPQYIVYDRNCDGLVDSLSHVLNMSLVQVNATSVGTANKNMLFWKADGKFLHHKLGMHSSRYLGVGTELAIEALKEKVDRVSWVSSNKFPVIDMRWIVSQYYSSVCNAANLNVSQNVLSERLKFIEDPWSIEKTSETVIVAEDEFNNAFEIARQFATRGEKESFVNVISSHYWLRDYMANNVSIFKQDAKAIPTITADYQRNATNVVYKLLMRMIDNYVAEDDIKDALDLIGEDTNDSYVSLRTLMLKYFFRVDENSDEDGIFVEKIDRALSTQSKIVVDKETMRPERKRYYAITDKSFVNEFLSQLKIVYYLAEDEKNKDNFLDSAMYGHVYQKYLPGMLISIEGKCYEIMSMTKNKGILVRRAADHITNRYYYRILKKYTLSDLRKTETIRGKYTHGGVTVERLETDIVVNTFGYLKMTEYSNIKNANKVELNNVEPREYRRKECIKLSFSGSTPEVRLTIATLLNELFVTVFPDTYPYIVATTKVDDPEKTMGMIPELDIDDDESIYIIEDSLIDLGLLNNVDRYIIRFFEIICDVLDWHKEKLSEENAVGEEETEIPAFADDDENSEDKTKKERRGLFGFIKGLFGKKKKRKNDDENGEEKVHENSSVSTASLRSFNKQLSADVNVLRDSEPDDSGIIGDDSESIKISGDGTGLPDEVLPYSKTFFLLYGYETVPEVLDIDQTLDYLNEQGFGDNYLKQTRDSNKYKKMKWYNYQFENGVHYCDFCGAELEGEFDLLDDGRERCAECSKHAITKVADFKKLYKKTRKQMEKVFGIKLKAKIEIKTCNAQKIAEELGEVFSPSPRFDGRTLGFARYGGVNDIYIENGSPEIETMKTLVHEMTHIWQYSNMMSLFNDRDLVVIEGMAVWTEVQFLTSIGLRDRAEAYIANRLMQNNEYGLGLKAYLEKFPIVENEKRHSKTPFQSKGNPLE